MTVKPALHRNIRKAMARQAWKLLEDDSFKKLLTDKVSSTGLRNLLAVAGEAVVLEELRIVLAYQKGRGQVGAKLAERLETELQLLPGQPALKNLPEGPERDDPLLVAARELLANLVRLQTPLIRLSAKS